MTDFLRRRALDLVVIGVALTLVIAVLATRGSVTTGEALARERNLLTAFREDDLTRIVIERAGQRVVLERGAAVDAGDRPWQLVEPEAGEAGELEVDAFITALEHATVARRLQAAEIDRARMGLTAPRFVLALEMGSVNYRLVVGGDAATPAGAAYVEVSGDGAPGKGVVIVKRESLEQLDVTVDELREPKLTPYLSDALRGLTLEGEGGTRKLRREGKHWRFDGMLADRLVDRRSGARLFVALVELQARDAVPLDAAQRITAAATERVTVTQLPAGDAPRAVLVLGGACPADPAGVVAWRREPDPRAACVKRDTLEALSVPAEAIVATRLLASEIDEIELFQVDAGERHLELARREAGFLLRKPREATVSHDVGTRRLLTLVETRGTFVEGADRAALGLEPPRARVRIATGGADESEVVEEELLVGEPDAEGTVPVLRKADGAVLRVDRASARALTPDATLLRPLELFDVEARDLRRVLVSGAVDQELMQGADGSLTLRRPAGFAIDAALAADLIATLTRLTADRWEADVDDGSFGLARPELRVRFEAERAHGESLARELVVGAPTSGGSFATLDGDGGVFVLARRDLDALTALVVDRSVFALDPERTTRVRLRTARAEVELWRVGGAFEQVSGEPRLPAATITRLLEALAALRPEGAVHTGAARAPEGFAEPILTVEVACEAGASCPTRLEVGSGDAWRGTSIHYARAAGVDATYALARSLASEIVDAL